MNCRLLAVVCFILCQAFCVSPYEIESKDENVLKRLLALLQKRQHGVCNDRLENSSEALKWCYGSRCTYEILDGTALLHVVYHENRNLLEVEVTDMNFENSVIVSESDFALPFYFNFSRDGHNYRAIVCDVRAPDEDSDNISAYTGLQEV